MRKHTRLYAMRLSAAAFFACVASCGGSSQRPSNKGGSGSGGSGGGGSGGASGGSMGPASGGSGDAGVTLAEDPNLAARKVDYGQALRTAAIKLTGSLPTMAEIKAVQDASSYATQIDAYLADARLGRQLVSYFRDMFKMGGTLAVVGANNATTNVSLDTAPTFAAELAAKDLNFTNLFTQATNTCPTFNAQTGAFTDASCAVANGLTTAGVLTDPGAMAQFYSNMSMRRVRWVQETFVCTKFPAEYVAKPVTMGAGLYSSPWPFASISGKDTGAPIDFHDTSSVICANCHTTMNHLAPMFANFDIVGVYQTSIQVHTPVSMTPLTKLSDWLPAGEQLSWRFQQALGSPSSPPAALLALGAAMAKDTDVLDCQVARAWNWAMSKLDIVSDVAVVPQSTIGTLEQSFVSSGYKMKTLLKAIFTSDDYVRF